MLKLMVQAEIVVAGEFCWLKSPVYFLGGRGGQCWVVVKYSPDWCETPNYPFLTRSHRMWQLYVSCHCLIVNPVSMWL